MSQNTNNWPKHLPEPNTKVFLGGTKVVLNKHDPKKSTTYHYMLLPGSGAQWVRQ